jgi:hypothetical protein
MSKLNNDSVTNRKIPFKQKRNILIKSKKMYVRKKLKSKRKQKPKKEGKLKWKLKVRN